MTEETGTAKHIGVLDSPFRKVGLIAARRTLEEPRPDAKEKNSPTPSSFWKTGTVQYATCYHCGSRVQPKIYHRVFLLMDTSMDEWEIAKRLYPDYERNKRGAGARTRVILQALRKLEKLGRIQKTADGFRWKRS